MTTKTEATPPARKPGGQPMDPALRLAAKLDRILAEISDEKARLWALACILAKYGEGMRVRVVPLTQPPDEGDER